MMNAVRASVLFTVLFPVTSVSFSAERPNVLMICVDDLIDWVG